MIILAPSVNPRTNASRSDRLQISFEQSTNLSRISFSSSFSRACSSASCCTIRLSTSAYSLLRFMSLSHGLILPYHKSSIIPISHLRNKESGSASGNPDSEPLRFQYLLVSSVSNALPPFRGSTNNITETDGSPENICVIF